MISLPSSWPCEREPFEESAATSGKCFLPRTAHWRAAPRPTPSPTPWSAGHSAGPLSAVRRCLLCLPGDTGHGPGHLHPETGGQGKDPGGSEDRQHRPDIMKKKIKKKNKKMHTRCTHNLVPCIHLQSCMVTMYSLWKL